VPVAGQPDRLGVLGGDLQGFPNGRRLTDDVVDIELQALVGAAQTGKLVDALAAGDKVDANDQAFGAAFPYVALPNGVGVNTAGSGSAAGSAPSTSEKPSAEAPAPSLTPAGYAGNADSGQVPMAVAVSAVGTAGVLALALLFLIGWWRRRSRPAPITPGSTDQTLQL
jgi:MYXO-CTERM domain-containing protein